MITIKSGRELARLRRLALAAQGLLQTRPFGHGLAGARYAIKHLGYVQIDTISVVERAHHHALYSRVPGFQPAMTNQMLRDGDVFEYWTHAAAFLPIEDFRFSLPYKQAIKNGQTHWFRNPDRKLMAELLDRIGSDGPLRSRDLEHRSPRRAGWWDWKPAKRALEQLYMEGDLMISDRSGFQKTYDLTTRVVPSWVDTRMPDMHEFAAYMVDQQLRCHGFSTLKGLTYQRRNPELRQAVKRLVKERLAERTLEQIRLDSGEIFILEAGALEQSLPRRSDRLLILSPFDNSLIQRDRLRSLFQFDYQLECYVPAAKRQFGYFCLPLLYRDQFVGRMDCKAYRDTRLLEIKSLYLEQPNLREDRIIPALVKALEGFRQFQQCDKVSLLSAYPNRLTRLLRAALESAT